FSVGVDVLATAQTASADSLQPGSVWVTQPGNFRFIVLDRQGERFKARFEIGKIIREVNGRIQGQRVHWGRRDVKAIAGDPGGENSGDVNASGTEIAMSWSDPNNTRGRYILRLKHPAPGSEKAGRAAPPALGRDAPALASQGREPSTPNTDY